LPGKQIIHYFASGYPTRSPFGLLANPIPKRGKSFDGGVDSLSVKDIKGNKLSLHPNIALAVLLVLLAGAAKGQKTARDLTESSLEDLMNIEVTTVSKKEQRLSQTPAAIYVITQEDIRRSGMTSLPDLLRMVPGLQVGQIQGGSWAVSARGFNDEYSNKLLVLVDGRSVYSPTDSGVFWDEQDTLLEDIERIEVIRGPGATLWGANAVNGIINIITKTAQHSQGPLAVTGVGDQGQALGAFRYGGELGDAGAYRAFVNYLDGRALSNVQGNTIPGGQSSLTAGFRTDWTLSSKDSLTVEGGLMRGRSGAEYSLSHLTPPFRTLDEIVEKVESGNILANWTHRQSDRSTTSLRVYFDRHDRADDSFHETYSTIDVDFQHQFALFESNDLVWGVGFRDSASRSDGSTSFSLSQPHYNTSLFSGFIQDQWKLAGDRFSVILGSKFEHNNYTGVEIQPGARFLWTPDSRHATWVAVSRAVRTPSAVDRQLQVLTGTFAGRGGTPTVIGLFGDPSFQSEDLLAYELGYRLQAKKRVSVDLAAFYNRYRHLETFEPGAPFFQSTPQPAHLVIPLRESNQMHGDSHGMEISSNWNVTGQWRLIPSYTWLKLDLHPDPTSHDTVSAPSADGKSPRNGFQFRSNLDLSRKLQLDAAVYYTGALPALAVDAYTRVDSRLGYRPRPDVDISFTGQNLQGGRHTEFVSSGAYTRATIGRSFFVKLTWGF
jgi:iron complex outermembrane recepter protein